MGKSIFYRRGVAVIGAFCPYPADTFVKMIAACEGIFILRAASGAARQAFLRFSALQSSLLRSPSIHVLLSVFFVFSFFQFFCFLVF